MDRRRGFTLIEVLIVVIILGILATLSVPQFTRIIGRARMAEAWAGLGAMRTAQSVYKMDTGVYATAIDDLDVDTQVGDFLLSIANANGRDDCNIATGNKAKTLGYVCATDNATGERSYQTKVGGSWTAWTD